MNIFEKVTQFTKEFATYIKEGAPNVTPIEYEERLRICSSCPSLSDKFTCNECGCNMEMKAKWRTSDCPKHKWPEPEKK